MTADSAVGMGTGLGEGEGPGFQLEVIDVIDETPDARSIVMKVTDDLRERFTYLPGQFLTFRIPSDQTGYVARSYSLSSAPGIDDGLKVTVKRTAGGYGSNWMCDNVVSGSTVHVIAPSGRFTPDGFAHDLLLFAAGSGITPVMSILKTALTRTTRKVELFYANRDVESTIFRDELAALADRYPDRLTVQHHLDDQQGLVTPDSLVELARTHHASEAFVCGPAPFMDLVGDALRIAGMPADRHHREVFLSLTGDPFGVVAPVTNDPSEPTVETVVHLDAQSHRFDWPVGQTLVDVLLDRGVDVPFQCRSGECGSCACTIVAGQVTMANSEILDPVDVADGFILGCQSRPDAGPIEIEF